MSLTIPEALAVAKQAEQKYQFVTPGAAARVLDCPDAWQDVTRDRADRLPQAAAVDTIAFLASNLIFLAAQHTPDMSAHTGKSTSHQYVTERIVSARSENMTPGEMALWRIKEAGYKLTGVLQGADDFVAIEVPSNYVFRFKDGRLLSYGKQWKNAYQLGNTFGDHTTSYSYEQILAHLKKMAQGKSLSEGYRWEVMEGFQESDAQDKIIFLAFGQIVPNRDVQRNTVNEQRASQLLTYKQAASDELIRAGVASPSKHVVSAVREILFGSPASAETKGLVALAELLSKEGVYIHPQQLVESMKLAYHAAWNSSLATPASATGRFVTSR
ncbi:hypothetical protein KA078_00645 [Candidatus Woesebacteria bacterium]|nr:hypothetical protein [Candidatus Woesebacteria bacterium]